MLVSAAIMNRIAENSVIFTPLSPLPSSHVTKFPVSGVIPSVSSPAGVGGSITSSC